MNLLEFEESLTLLKKSEDFGLRNYQLKAARNIVEKGNSLLIMPTALGKTFVAVLIIAHYLKKYEKKRQNEESKENEGQKENTKNNGQSENAEKQPPENNGEKILFLAPTKPLAAQQANRFKQFLKIDEEKIQVLSGDLNPIQRKEVWEKGLIFAATPQTVANDLMTGKISINDFRLIFFDEVHKAIGDYDYVFIANSLKGRNEHAILVGMTASPSSEMDKIMQICETLHIKNLEIFEEKDAEEYSQQIKTQFRFVKLSGELLEIKGELQKIFYESIEPLKPFGLKNRPSKKDLLGIRTTLLTMAQGNPSIYKAISQQAKALNLMHAIDLLECEGLEVLINFFDEMETRKDKSKAVKSLLEDERIKFIKGQCKSLLKDGLEHPKIAELKNVLESEIKKSESIIIFAHFRNSIKKIVSEINNMPGIKAKQFIGKTEGMSKKEQMKTIEDFRNQEFNVLVASSIGEEGLDIPTVDTVIFYETVPSEIRAIQRRGRTGRVKEGKAIILITQGTKDEAYYWISRKKERMMKENIEKLRSDMTRSRKAEDEKKEEDQQKENPPNEAKEPEKKPEEKKNSNEKDGKPKPQGQKQSKLGEFF